MSETLKPHCHHDTVRRQIEDHGDRTDKWKCACGEEFYRLDLQPGKVKLLQPAAPTLRDQFAMAALTGMLFSIILAKVLFSGSCRFCWALPRAAGLFPCSWVASIWHFLGSAFLLQPHFGGNRVADLC